MMATVTCPRCAPADRGATPDGSPGNEGYIFWDDATEQEQQDAIANGTPADSDGEIPCPLCEQNFNSLDDARAQAWHDAQKPPVEPAIRGLDWAGVPNPDDIPPAKFRFEWEDDDHANVIAIPPEPGEPVRIGLLSFDTAFWCFTRLDNGGTQLVGADTIECDARAEAELRKLDEDARINASTSTSLEAQLAAVEVKARLYRDDSRDIAELGARIIARKWWRIFWTADPEVTEEVLGRSEFPDLIRRRHGEGATIAAIAKEFGISRSEVVDILG